MARTKDHGYGGEHEKRRVRESKTVATGKAICWRCSRRISPHENWDLGHDDNDRTKYMGPEHVACNRATKRHAAANVVDDSREW